MSETPVVDTAREQTQNPETGLTDEERSWETRELQTVRWLAVAEGVSLLLLFFVAMPVKYLMDYPLLVKWVGPVHGVLFLLYVAVLVMWRGTLKWSWGHVLLATVAASVPFATFFPYFHGPAAPSHKA